MSAIPTTSTIVPNNGSTSTVEPPSTSSSSNKMWIIIAVIVAIIIIIIVAIVLIVIFTNDDSTPSSTCTTDSDCISGQICVNGSCVTADCTSSSDCPSGDLCIKGKCITSVLPCKANTDCPAGLVCTNGACELGQDCTSNSDCPSGQNCNTTIGHCETGQPCNPANPTCLTGYYCNTDNFVCEPGCSANSDCSSNQVCYNNKCLTISFPLPAVLGVPTWLDATKSYFKESVQGSTCYQALNSNSIGWVLINNYSDSINMTINDVFTNSSCSSTRNNLNLTPSLLPTKSVTTWLQNTSQVNGTTTYNTLYVNSTFQCTSTGRQTNVLSLLSTIDPTTQYIIIEVNPQFIVHSKIVQVSSSS